MGRVAARRMLACAHSGWVDSATTNNQPKEIQTNNTSIIVYHLPGCEADEDTKEEANSKDRNTH